MLANPLPPSFLDTYCQRRLLSIRLFCYDLTVLIFCSKIVLLPSHPVVDMSSHILSYLQVQFSFVVLECPVFFFCIVWSYLFSLLSLVPSNLFLRVVSFVPVVLLHPKIFSHFYCLSIRLLCDWSFHLYHHITYICYFVESFQFWLGHN